MTKIEDDIQENIEIPIQGFQNICTQVITNDEWIKNLRISLENPNALPQ